MSSKWTVWTLTFCWIYFLFVGRYLPLEEIFKIIILKVFFKVKIDTESHEKQMYAGHILMVHFSMTYIFSANLAAGSRGMMRHILDSYSKNMSSSVFFYHVMSSHMFFNDIGSYWCSLCSSVNLLGVAKQWYSHFMVSFSFVSCYTFIKRCFPLLFGYPIVPLM